MKLLRMTLILIRHCLLPLIVCAGLPWWASAGEQGAMQRMDMKPIMAGERRCVLLTEQTQGRIMIADIDTGKIIWTWHAAASRIRPEHVDWFGYPSDAKVVYGGECVLMCASQGGIALVRILDREVLYYANAVGSNNPHSIELLPDGNIVSASSNGNHLALFKVNKTQLPGEIYRKVSLADAHNVVWDDRNKVLWSASENQLKAFEYHGGSEDPQLCEAKSIPIPDSEAHDLFPVHGQNALWVSTAHHVYQYDIVTEAFREAATEFQSGIKSVSSGPMEFPILLMRPKEQWWTDEVIDSGGRRIFHQDGMRFYKARWVLNNFFSYPRRQGVSTLN